MVIENFNSGSWKHTGVRMPVHTQTIAGAGGCTHLLGGGAVGTGYFVWPAVNHFLSGNDYWSGHLGIDIAAGEGAAIYAADSGVVVYAGAIGGGYGNMIMIDHGNGYHTLYAHLSVVSVYCGQSIYQGKSYRTGRQYR